MVDTLLYLCGEEKKLTKEWEIAWTDLNNKVKGGFPEFRYPNLDHIWCFGAAHKLFQFGIIPVRNSEVQSTPIGRSFKPLLRPRSPL